MNVGLFINALINFLIVGIVISSSSKPQPHRASAHRPPRRLPLCLSKVPDQATRCPHCTSQLEPSEP